MLSKSTIHTIKGLGDKKNRQLHNLFIVEGKKGILELIKANKFEIDTLLLTDESTNQIKDLSNINYEIISNKELERISQLSSPEFGLALVAIPEKKELVYEVDDCIVALDGLNDPGNLGTIIRICDWFGISNIICSEHTVDPYSPKVVQSSMGSMNRVNILSTDLKGWLNGLSKDIKVYATTLKGKNINSIKPQKPCVIIIGSESHGISRDIIEISDEQISIPKSLKSEAESLNAAMACSIFAYWQSDF